MGDAWATLTLIITRKSPGRPKCNRIGYIQRSLKGIMVLPSGPSIYVFTITEAFHLALRRVFKIAEGNRPKSFL